jgi:Flp pilus assembly protein TadD
LEASARRTACQATKKDLKPSAVSAYWSHQAWSFIRLHPGQAISLWGRKFLLFWTRFDIPNSTNFYFIRSEFAPVLYLAFIGFWLVGPLGLTGLALRLANRTREQDKFLAAFVGIYTLSLLPFFMADRYRLPVIAVLTAYAVLAVWEARAWIKSKSVSRLLVWGMVLAAAELLVNVPWIYPSFLNYSNDRLWVAGQYINRSLANPQAGYQDLARGFLELKQSLETDPYSPDGYYDLGLAYTHVGCHSGAVRELSRALELQPNSPRIQQALQAAQKKLLATGDTLAEDKLPRTIFEQALDEEDHHHTEAAIALYQAAIEKDPFHFDACQHLGTLLFQSGKMQEAITVLQQGAAANPMHLPTWNNLAVAYSQTGDLANARRALRICLELKPDDPVYLQQLRKLDDSSGRTR